MGKKNRKEAAPPYEVQEEDSQMTEEQAVDAAADLEARRMDELTRMQEMIQTQGEQISMLTSNLANFQQPRYEPTPAEPEPLFHIDEDQATDPMMARALNTIGKALSDQDARLQSLTNGLSTMDQHRQLNAQEQAQKEFDDYVLGTMKNDMDQDMKRAVARHVQYELSMDPTCNPSNWKKKAQGHVTSMVNSYEAKIREAALAQSAAGKVDQKHVPPGLQNRQQDPVPPSTGGGTLPTPGAGEAPKGRGYDWNDPEQRRNAAVAELERLAAEQGLS